MTLHWKASVDFAVALLGVRELKSATDMSSHHELRYCFARFWFVAATGDVYAQFTTGEYYVYTGGGLALWVDLSGFIAEFGGIGTDRNVFWPIMMGTAYYKTTGPPAVFDDTILGYNPDFPPT